VLTGSVIAQHFFLLFPEKIYWGGGGGILSLFAVFFEGGLGKGGRMLVVFCG
jgi:hypothetical protein